MRRLLIFVATLPLLLINFAPHTIPVSAASGFQFNWTASPASPQTWVPGGVNDWDLFSNIDGPTDLNGTMNAGHGAGCEPPPSTHVVRNLLDSSYICNNHMMTAINGGRDAWVSYGAIYFAPAQMLDWSQGQASLSWKVSTQRLSSRDWWQVNLTPFDQNLVMPTELRDVAYQGLPSTGLELRIDNLNCVSSFGSFIRVLSIAGGADTEITQQTPCVETTVPPSFTARSQFQVDITGGHLKVYMPGTTTVWYDGPINLPFKQAVVQFSHHSYNPEKGENPDGSAGLPNTYHWSDVSLSPASPFTMLRPVQPFSLHAGQNPVLVLPQAAPKNAFLRFAGLGDIQYSVDGGKSYQPVRLQGGQSHPEHMASYFTPIPEGTTQVQLKGQPNSSQLPWWVEDVSIWASTAVTVTAPQSQAPAAPRPAPASTTAGVDFTNPHEVLQPQTAPASARTRQAASSGFLAVVGRVPPAIRPGLATGGLLTLAVVAALAVAWRRRRPGRSGQPGGPPQ